MQAAPIRCIEGLHGVRIAMQQTLCGMHFILFLLLSCMPCLQWHGPLL